MTRVRRSAGKRRSEGFAEFGVAQLGPPMAPGASSHGSRRLPEVAPDGEQRCSSNIGSGSEQVAVKREAAAGVSCSSLFL